MEDNFRFSGFNWFDKVRQSYITIGGAGGIGSYVAFLLARAQVKKIDIYDFDTVEQHNLGCQLFFRNSLHDKKTQACRTFIQETTDLRSYFQEYDKVTPETIIYTNVVFSCFDNFEARKILFNLWKNDLLSSPTNYQKEFIFIDGRLDGELLQVYCVTKDNYLLYEETLQESSLTTMGTLCTMQQTSHIGAMIGGYMVSFYTNFMSNLAEGIEAREVPYFFEMYTPLAQPTIISNIESKKLVAEKLVVKTTELPF